MKLNNNSKILLIILILIFLLVLTIKAIASDAITLEIIDSDDTKGLVSARINNLSPSAKEVGVDQVIVSGYKKSDSQSNVVDINWNQLNLNDKSATLSQPFKSKISLDGSLEGGDTFSAKGSKEILAKSIEELLQDQGGEGVEEEEEGSGNNSNKSTANTSLSGGANNSSKSSTLSGFTQDPLDVITDEADPEEIEVSEGCTFRVDYDLAKVFEQQRTLKGGEEIRSCYDSTTFYQLDKDYEVCPDIIDKVNRQVTSYYQYSFTDSASSKVTIGSCEEDPARSIDIVVNKDYGICSDFVDYGANMVYERYEESYQDNDDSRILLQDCTVDYQKLYPIINLTCEPRHLFDEGYSIAQESSHYTKNDEVIAIQDCHDVSQTYQHSTTSDTCSSVINGDAVTIFTRKSISVDGVTQYISECSPENSNVLIQEEDCASQEFTHNMTSGQSFRNKNYFYYDNEGQRVEVSNCIASEESFNHEFDLDACSTQDDDANLETINFAKTFITVNGTKEYIDECHDIGANTPYGEVGYKWVEEYNLPTASISVSNAGDNVYLGASAGEASWNRTTCKHDQINVFNINNYNEEGRCGTSSPSYAGNAIDTTLSDLSTISYDEYVQEEAGPDVILETWTSSCSYKTSVRTIGNTLYTQRCTNYTCPLAKVVKIPIYKRPDNTLYYHETTTRDPKYLCGETLNGTEVYY